MANNRNITVFDFTDQTATQTGGAMDLTDYKDFHAILSVTAASGTDETLDVKFQHSVDGAVWLDHTSFTQATAATSELKTMANVCGVVRAVATIGGTATPTFTYELKVTCKA
ncbi:MAG: hypothetical protein KAS66_05295 [Candidatus Omnitrophica bacterium]|nr:hypothetical protein [Candidatus Omnitrophota bacterium]